ncbi:MAG: AI-2E family transporter [Actinomycetota bacterium]|nr:AI-2E family transporter [Actinomycetota bacterium]
MSTTLRITPTSLIRATLIVAGSLVVAMVAGRATTTLWWFAQSAVFAALAYPLVERLGRHMPKFVGVLVITGALALAAVGLGTVAFTELRAEANRFETAVPAAVDRLEQIDGIGTLMKDLNVRHQAERFAEEMAERIRFQDADLPGVASKVGGSASASFIVWILTVMLVFTGPSMVRAFIDLAPARTRGEVDRVARTAYARAAGYMGAMSARAVVVLVLAYTLATVLDLDMPGLLAVVAALLSFVPFVGILAGSLPIALMALLDGPSYSIGVLVGALVLQVVEVFVLQRRINQHTVNLGLFLTLAAAMIGFSFRGPGGLLTAVAVAAMIVAVVNDTAAVQALRAAAHSDGTAADPDDAAHAVPAR